VNRLIDVALRIVDGPMPTEPKNLARGLSTAAQETDHRGVIRDKLRRALAGDPMHHIVACALLHYGTFGHSHPGRDRSQPLRRYVGIPQRQRPTLRS
jgi:hypothetical protein